MADETRGRNGWAAALAAVALAGATWSSVASADCGGGCGDSLTGSPADAFVAERLGLVREWVVQLPFDSARAQVEHVVVGDGLVVAQTGDGGVHAVRAAGSAAAPPGSGTPALGSLLWSRRLDATRGGSTPPGIGPDLVTITRGDSLLALDRDTGGDRWQERLGRLPDVGAVQVGEWVYAPLPGGGMRRVTFDPFQPTADASATATARPAKKRAPGAGKRQQVAAKPTQESLRQRTFDTGGPVARPARPLAKGVAWVTTGGVLVALVPTDLGWERSEFALNAATVDAPVTRDDSVFAATRAADLARVDFQATGGRGLRTAWHVVLDAQPDAGPFLSGDAVVVSLGETGLAAFSAETGAPRWRSGVAGRVLAITAGRVWIIDRTGRLTGIDLATGERRERACLAGFSVPVVNAETDRLLLASPDGVLVSLAPRRPAPKPADRGPPPPPQQPAADDAT